MVKSKRVFLIQSRELFGDGVAQVKISDIKSFRTLLYFTLLIFPGEVSSCKKIAQLKRKMRGRN